MSKYAIASAVTLGFTFPSDQNAVDLILYGPRGGQAGSACLSPTEARKLAMRLNDAANEVDPQ